MNRRSASSLALLCSLSLAAVACGDESYVVDDPKAASAANGEGAPQTGANQPGEPGAQAPAEPSATAPVVVAVRGVNGLPEAGVDIVFHDANGAVIGEAKTGADGRASSPAGTTPAMASALLGDYYTKHVVTWTSVKPGDVLETNNIASLAAPSVGTYGAKAQAAMPGALYYKAYTADCMASAKDVASHLSIKLLPSCVKADNTNSVLMFATGDLGKPIGYAYAKGLALPNQFLMAPATAWKPMDGLDVIVTNLGDLTAESEAFEVAGGVQFVRNWAPVKGEKATFAVAGAFADSFQAHAYAANPNELAGWFAHSKRVAASSTEVTIDYGNHLPAIVDKTMDQSDPARPLLAWKSAQPLTGADGGHVSLRWYENNNDVRGWTLLVAPGTTSVKVPALPASAAAFAPTTDLVNPPTLVFVESDAWADHDAFRRSAARMMPIGELYGIGFVVRLTVLPADGMSMRGTEL